MTDQFLNPIPKKFLEDPEVAEWARSLTLLLDDITREDGVIATGAETTAVVLTQQEKLDLMTVTAAVNLDTVKAASEASTASLTTIQSDSPAYTISNDGTDRTFDADAAAGTISSPVAAPADIQRNQTAILELSDVVATVIRDLKTKGVFG
jgi:hypothetical protein